MSQGSQDLPRQVWSSEFSIPVESGFRRLSVLPQSDGRQLVVDSTGSGGYGLLVLGEARPLDDGRYAAVDPQGRELGAGGLPQAARLLFEAHPNRRDVLSRGVAERCPPSTPANVPGEVTCQTTAEP